MSSNNKRTQSSGSTSPQPRKRQLIDGEQQDMDIELEPGKLEQEGNSDVVLLPSPDGTSDLEQAKIMLKRLDYKSAIELCDKVRPEVGCRSVVSSDSHC